ncbi:MAG TPA: ribulose-bisphosphate carboxylase large subunit [Candidatus Methanofastidiosa archaeon]|nr:ribulose-bisphosphate carboxylase large subunit [Candidatus Methanofastidiosa archaeon]HPR41014.1 ribulose-bisphosphate carboxylase large subunit [Candidatus Methanofastidiosa archaeon]
MTKVQYQDKFVDTAAIIDPKEYVICHFYIEADDVRKAANVAAGESSVGTWTKITTMKERIEKLAAKVFHIDGNYVKIAYPIDMFVGNSIPQLLSDVAGNILGMKEVNNLRLNRIDLPDEYVDTFKGPAFGMKGVRRLLGTEKSGRPHVGTIVKPKIGLNPKETAKVAYEAYYGGCDFVKDDENLTDQRFCPFEDRVVEVLEALDRASEETGEKKAYAPNVTGPDMLDKAQFVKDQGGTCAMIDIIAAGYYALQELRDADLGLFLHGHRAMHAAITRNPLHGVSMGVLALLSRLGGVDQLHIGTVIGKMEGDLGEVLFNKEQLERPLSKMETVFAVCSGGLHPGHVAKLMELMGNDIVIQAGGGIHGHPDGTIEGARALRQAVDAKMLGIDAREYSKDHIQLKKALDLWGST